MCLRASAALCLSFGLALLGPGRLARALETDQYTVPDKPLADIGPEVDVYVAATIWEVIQEANGEAARHERLAARAGWDRVRDYHRGRAGRYRTEDHVARRLFEMTAGGAVPECKIELWVKRRRFNAARREGRPARFGMTCDRAVFGNHPFEKPWLLVDLSPTVKVHGAYMGLDKLGHFFQQGHEYFRAYREEESRGGGEAARLAKAVRIGVAQERGIYGEAMVGVYSNADLAANYAGMKFYLNLTRPVRVGDATLPPLLARGPRGEWVFNPRRGGTGAADLLRPFVGEHFNEALNPSRYKGRLHDAVRRNLRRRVEEFASFYKLDFDSESQRLSGLATWHGERYGHSGPRRLISVANLYRPSRAPDRAPAPAEARTADARLPAEPQRGTGLQPVQATH